MELSAQSMGHAVRQAESAVVEGHARHAGAEQHHLAGFHVFHLLIGLEQEGEYIAYGLHRKDVREGVVFP